MSRVVLHATITVKPELVDDFKKVMKDVIRGSLQEEGCEYYVVTFDIETKNRAKVFEIYKSPEAVDAHMTGVAFSKFKKWFTDNNALAEPLGLEKHYLLEDVEKGIVA